MPKLRQALPSLANALRLGELPLATYLEQLKQRFDSQEPLVRAFVAEEDRFERLAAEAEKLQETYPEPLNRPPLFGIPMGVKDIFHADGFVTRAGSQMPPEDLQGPEAHAVSILKESGALIVGKTVTTEFAYFAPGPTRNPHAPDHTPGGSSSGSAAAVASGLCTVALGTQTIGSIIRPASYCGVVGYKPSYDRVSRHGVIPLAPSLDHVGVFAVEIAGCELVASLLCRDWHLAVVENKPVLGVPEGPYLENATEEGLAHFAETCRHLTDHGFIVKSVPAFRNFDDIVARHNLILAAEAAQVHADWYAGYGECYQAKTAELIERGRSITVGELAEALTGRQRLRQKLSALMDEHGLDLWISPAATGPAPKGLGNTGSPVMNLPWTHSGLPTINLPSGVNTQGLPLGLQVAGHWYEDERLFEWSAVLEMVVRSPTW